MNYWWLIFAMALVTFLPRYLPMAFANKLKLSPLILRALEFVPIAVLSVIIAQTSFYRAGVLEVSLNNAHLLAAAVSVIIGIVTRHMFSTIAAGLVVFALLKLIAG